MIRLANEAPHIHKLNHSLVTIGRDSTNDIVLETSAVSRHHARLEWRRGVWYITDLDSTNGTGIDDNLLEPHTMRVFPFEQRASVGPYEIELRRNLAELPELTQYLIPKEVNGVTSYWNPLDAPETLPTSTQKNFTFSMWPQKAVHNGKVFVAIQNEANITQRFKLSATSDAALSFTSATWEVTVPAGVEKRVAFIVHADERPLLGDISHPEFEIEVESDGNQHQSSTGTVAIASRLSQRMLLFSLTMLFLVLISYLVTGIL
ncbi:MAG: FHA domain-containing protein [Candidatus Promineifilaceae bacterium]